MRKNGRKLYGYWTTNRAKLANSGCESKVSLKTQFESAFDIGMQI